MIRDLLPCLIMLERHDHRWDLPEKFVLNSWLADLRARATRDHEGEKDE